jgi:hypothetical protein
MSTLCVAIAIASAMLGAAIGIFTIAIVSAGGDHG